MEAAEEQNGAPTRRYTAMTTSDNEGTHPCGFLETRKVAG